MQLIDWNILCNPYSPQWTKLFVLQIESESTTYNIEPQTLSHDQMCIQVLTKDVVNLRRVGVVFISGMSSLHHGQVPFSDS